MAKKKSKLPIMEALGVVAGSLGAGIATKLVDKMLPTLPGYVKSVLPIGAGVLLAGNKNTIIRGAGFGMIAKGGADLAASLLPNLISGVDDIFLSEPADQSILSLPADQSVLSGEEFVGEEFVGEEFVGEEFVGEELALMGIEEN
jgi:hypothetical protein